MALQSRLRKFITIRHQSLNMTTSAWEERHVPSAVPMAFKRPRHRIEHTRNKHSRAVYKENTIIIRLAKNLSKTEEQEHIQSLLRRMTHLILEERQKTSIDPFRHLLDGGQSLTVTLATGKKVHMSLVPASRSRARTTGRGWLVEVSPQLRRAALHRMLWSIVCKSENQRVEELVHTLNRQSFRVPVSHVRLRFATTQWGSCSPRGTIMLNAALLFLPPSLLRYVIIHELAHRLHANHSAQYWRTVERALPGYRRARALLHDYRLPHA